MPMPENTLEQLDAALQEAWYSADQCKRLLETNNTSSAVVWAASAQAWATLAQACAARRQ
jgi:hypothetical protein